MDTLALGNMLGVTLVVTLTLTEGVKLTFIGSGGTSGGGTAASKKPRIFFMLSG